MKWIRKIFSRSKHQGGAENVFHDFVARYPSREQKKIMLKVADEANKEQRELMDRHAHGNAR